MTSLMVDPNMLRTPFIAVQQVKYEIVNMAGLAIGNFDIALDIVWELDFSKEEEFVANERELNYINRELIK